MIIVIVIAVTLAAVLIGWAFWPRSRGIVDGDVRQQRRNTSGRGEYYGGLQ